MLKEAMCGDGQQAPYGTPALMDGGGVVKKIGRKRILGLSDQYMCHGFTDFGKTTSSPAINQKWRASKIHIIFSDFKPELRRRIMVFVSYLSSSEIWFRV